MAWGLKFLRPELLPVEPPKGKGKPGTIVNGVVTILLKPPPLPGVIEVKLGIVETVLDVWPRLLSCEVIGDKPVKLTLLLLIEVIGDIEDIAEKLDIPDKLVELLRIL